MNELETLQAEEADTNSYETEVVNDVETAIPERDVDSAPTEQEDKVVFDERQQAKVNNLIGEKVKATREIEREAERLREQMQELKAKIPKEARPNIPDIPNSFDEDFESKVALRDKAIQDAAAFDARQATLQEQEQNAQHQEQIKQQQALVNTAQTYEKRAGSLGISKDDLTIAGQTVAANGLSNDLALHILNDDKGPLITDYLAKNPLDQDSLRGMTPMQAAIHLETVIKPKAAISRKPTQAPDPATIVNGGGSPVKERGPKGATFE